MRALTLPYPPSVNHYWRNLSNGRTVISREGRAYRELVWALMREQGVPKQTGRLDVHVALVMPDKRRRDIDNAMKALLDSLAYASVYEDDSQIDKLTVERCQVEPPGAAIVTVSQRITSPLRWALDHCS